MGSHVSASPNHQTGRSTPLGTRAVVAMSGTFGYELDPAALTAEEKEKIREQIVKYHSWQDLIREGDYFRLGGEDDNRPYTAWQMVSTDKTEALLNFVLKEPSSNPKPLHLRLKGLDPDARYLVESADFYGCRATLPHDRKRVFTGAALMYGGYTLPIMQGDYPSAQIFWKKVSQE